MSGGWKEDRLRFLAECLANATKVAESGVQVDEASLSDFERRMLEHGRTLAEGRREARAREDARVSSVIGQSRNVVDARRVFRAR